LKLRGSKAPRRSVTAKKVGNKTELANVWQVSFGNAESAVATAVLIFTIY
jgi:hypothetical protein